MRRELRKKNLHVKMKRNLEVKNRNLKGKRRNLEVKRKKTTLKVKFFLLMSIWMFHTYGMTRGV